MTLIKTSFLSGIAVVIKILTLLSINKVLAVYVGPSGYAVIGQFQNAMQVITALASGAINTGVTKYTAQYHDDPQRQSSLLKTAGSVTVIGSVSVALLIALLSERLSVWIFLDERYSGVFIWFAAALVFFSFNTFLLAVLNGKKEIKRYVAANIGGSVLSLLVVSLLAVFFGLYGALVALAIYQSVSLLITLLLCANAAWFGVGKFFGRIDKQILADLSKYAAMALTSAICVPISHMLVRNYLGVHLGVEASGYWEAMWRLSAAYLMLVTMTLSVYYLPRFSELTGASAIGGELARGYAVIIPATAVMGGGLFLLKDVLIVNLLSVDFMPMRELFFWQVVGDTLKIAGWLVAYIMLGKGMAKLFIVSEIIFAASFFLFVSLFVREFGLVGAAIAHAVNYAFYWLVISYFVWRKAVATDGWRNKGDIRA